MVSGILKKCKRNSHETKRFFKELFCRPCRILQGSGRAEEVARKLYNAKDWTMTNVVLRAESQVKLKNCTNVQLPMFELKEK